MKQHFYFCPSSIFLKKSMHGRVCFKAQSVSTDQKSVSKLGKSVRCAVAVLLLTRWITLSQVLRIRISTLTQSGSGGGGEKRGVINFVTRILPNIATTK